MSLKLGQSVYSGTGGSCVGLIHFVKICKFLVFEEEFKCCVVSCRVDMTPGGIEVTQLVNFIIRLVKFITLICLS